MGNEQSNLVDHNAPTVTLEERNLESVAKLIKDGKIKRIVVMTGAGLSTAAGSESTKILLERSTRVRPCILGPSLKVH